MKGFGEEEREIIRRKLMRKGRGVFARHGLKGATIRQLAREAGISSGSFYSFFDSKERLFLRILAVEIEAAKERNMAKVSGVSGPPVERMRAFLRNALEDIRTNPVLSRMLVPEDRELVARMMEAERPCGKSRADLGTALADAVLQLRGEGAAGESPEMAAAVVRSLFILASHGEEIGEEVFPSVMDRLAGYVAKGLAEGTGGEGGVP